MRGTTMRCTTDFPAAARAAPAARHAAASTRWGRSSAVACCSTLPARGAVRCGMAPRSVRDDLERAAGQAGVEIGKGDVVLIRTGWAESEGRADVVSFDSEPGLDVEAALWLAEREIAVLGADNFAVEVIPFAHGHGVSGASAADPRLRHSVAGRTVAAPTGGNRSPRIPVRRQSAAGGRRHGQSDQSDGNPVSPPRCAHSFFANPATSTAPWSARLIADPVPGPREVVIRVAFCGVCAHDVAVCTGTLRAGIVLPCVPGHEIAGTVVAIGECGEAVRRRRSRRHHAARVMSAASAASVAADVSRCAPSRSSSEIPG